MTARLSTTILRSFEMCSPTQLVFQASTTANILHLKFDTSMQHLWPTQDVLAAPTYLRRSCVAQLAIWSPQEPIPCGWKISHVLYSIGRSFLSLGSPSSAVVDGYFSSISILATCLAIRESTHETTGFIITGLRCLQTYIANSHRIQTKRRGRFTINIYQCDQLRPFINSFRVSILQIIPPSFSLWRNVVAMDAAALQAFTVYLQHQRHYVDVG